MRNQLWLHAAALLAGALLLVPNWSFAQGSRDDYERSQTLQQRTRGKVFRDRVNPNWLEGGAKFWYEITVGPNRRQWVLVDAENGERRPAFDHARLAEALTQAAGEKVEAENLPLRNFRPSGDLSSAQFTALGKRWECNLTDYTLRDVGAQNDERTTVTVLERPRPSQAEGAKTTIRFINRLSGPVKLLWVEPSGERTSYGTIEADKEQEQSTYAGHVWLVTDENERPLGVFEATADAGVAVIDDAARGRGFGRGGRGRGARGGPRGREARPQSPDGQWQAAIENHNVVLRNLKSEEDEKFKLTTDGTADDPYLARFYWSPDSTRLAVLQEKVGENRKIQLVESSPRDQVQPKIITVDYPKPGDKLPVARPRLFDITERKQIPISDELSPNAWSITEMRWQPDSSRFTFLYNPRGHQALRIVAVDAKSGEAKPIIDERSETFVDYAHKQFSQYLDVTNEIVWMSERDGWNHLYLHNADTGEVKNQITRGPWVVRGVERVDVDKRQIWFRAGGIRPEQDPYYVHYCRVNFDGTGLVVLTEGDGTHDVDFSPNGQFLIDTYSRVDMPPVTELRRTVDGTLVCQLEQAEWSELLSTGWRPPQRFVAKGRDGQTDIYGVIYRPTNFDSEKKYPVIEKIYAGPQGAFVPKSFVPYYEAQALAELGFIVVQIDGMGTSYRSKKFHDVCCKNLGDSGFPDRILWMQAAAKKYPQMDISRVGVYGGSAGAQSALRALLAHGDFYKAAVADCGCHDNRMDKVWWNELWMGWPVGPHYAEQSNVTQAHKLQGKLLLIVGELDRNVDPASTLQVVNALVKANKDFEFLLVPGAGHGIGSGPYGTRRSRDFFVRNLLGKEPRWLNKESEPKQDAIKRTDPAS